MKKKIVISMLLAGILALSSCGEKKAEDSTATTTTAASAGADQTEEKAEDTSEESETDAPETTDADTETETEEETEANTEDGETSQNTADAAEIPGDKVIEAGVECSFESVLNATKAILENDNLAYNMTTELKNSEQSMTMSSLIIKSSEYGTYTDVDMGIMKTKMIYFNDGRIVLFLDDSKQYVITTQEESGMTMSEDTNSGIVTVKEPVNTADLVEFENTGKRAYRFLITADNNASDDAANDIYVYADADTLLLCGIYGITQGVEQKAYITISNNADASYFQIPSDYTEITMEEYQKKMMEAFSVNIPDDDGSDAE